MSTFLEPIDLSEMRESNGLGRASIAFILSFAHIRSGVSSILPGSWDWPSAIGNFMLNFGQLDWCLMVFLEKHVAPDEFDRISNEHFKDRADRVQLLLECPDRSEKEMAWIANFFKRLHNIRELRNRIAHGNMHLEQSADRKTFTLSLRPSWDLNPEPAHGPSTLRLTFEELSRACADLSKLLHDFQTEIAGWTATALTQQRPTDL